MKKYFLVKLSFRRSFDISMERKRIKNNAKVNDRVVCFKARMKKQAFMR